MYYYLLKLLCSCLLLIYCFHGGIQLLLKTCYVCSLLCLLCRLRLLCLLGLLGQLFGSKGVLNLRTTTAGGPLQRTAFILVCVRTGVPMCMCKALCVVSYTVHIVQ